MATEQVTETRTTSSPTKVTPRSVYRAFAIAETVTWTLLILGMVLKYGLDLGRLPVLIGGSIHGFVFIAYALAALIIGVNQRWGAGRTVLAVATAVIPYATIPFERHLERTGRLKGDWHRIPSDDPHDQTRTRRLLRVLVNHPVALIVVFVVAVVVIMSVLLILGPPGIWGSH